MRDFLEEERGPPLPGWPDWHEGNHRYHLFHTCHHFTAGALRAAGLPISPGWALSGGATRLLLDRVRRFHEEEGLAAAAGAP